MPCRLDSPDDSIPKSGMAVLPSNTQPASRMRAGAGASAACGGAWSLARVPIGAGSPWV
jgi:hypothetical protein